MIEYSTTLSVSLVHNISYCFLKHQQSSQIYYDINALMDYEKYLAIFLGQNMTSSSFMLLQDSPTMLQHYLSLPPIHIGNIK